MGTFGRISCLVALLAVASVAMAQNPFKIKFGLRSLKPRKGMSIKVKVPSKALKSVMNAGPRHVVNDWRGNLIQEGARVEIINKF